jgi:hypothetical protein
VNRGYAVSIIIGSETAAEAFGHTLGIAHKRALDALRAWIENRPEHIEHALEVTIETAQAERGR